MPVSFSRSEPKPENALKRAKEFLEVEKKELALGVLAEVIRSKKHKQWTVIYQRVIQLYLELCIDLQNSIAAKDGLYHYRNICRDTNLNSFHVIVNDFLTALEEKAVAARKESEQVVRDMEDLGMMQTPESWLLSTVSSEDTQDRQDRAVLYPWFRFLWESFRNILDMLKNSTQMETIYASVAKRAFGFYYEYKRRTEFRKLCDLLRGHLRNAQEHQQVQNYSQETLQCLVEVRFELLGKAISIGYWQEAFRAIEDIHALISGPKHRAKPSLLENFYQKQASFYWMANNKLFHAAALYRLFVLWKEQKKTFSMESEEAKRTASLVLLATLSAPIQPIPSEIDRFLMVDTNAQGKSRRLADLLRMQVPPTRASLLKDLCHHGILSCVPFHLQQLYSLLEVEFNPLSLCEKVSPLLDQLEATDETKQYVESLKEVTLVRLIKQVSQIYQSIQLTRLCKLARFADPVQMERLVVETARTNDIPVRIDHITDSFWFGAELDLAHHSKAPEGPVVQCLPSELFCDHISAMAQALQQASSLVFQKDSEAKLSKKYHKVAVRCRETEVLNHKAIMKRAKAIEERNEHLEAIQAVKEEMEKEEKQKQREEENANKKLMQEKLDEELKKKQDMEISKMIRHFQMRTMEDKVENWKKTETGAKAFGNMTVEELLGTDPNLILKKQLDKEMRDKETKLKGQGKKIDYTERVKRLFEIPKRRKEYLQQIEANKKIHEAVENEKVEKAIKQREEAVTLKNRLGVMDDSRKEFLKIINEKREAALKEKMLKFEARLNEERQKRLEKRKLERMEKRKVEAIAMKKAEEEREAHEKLESERIQKEEEKLAHLEKMEQQRLIQLKREKEVEEKQKKKEEERMLRIKVKNEPPKLIDDDWRQGHQEDSWRKPPEQLSPPQTRREPYHTPQRRGKDRWRSDPSDRDRQDSGDSPWGSGRSWRDSQRPEHDTRDDRYSRDRPPLDRYGGDRDRPSDRYGGYRDRDRPDRGSSSWGSGGGSWRRDERHHDQDSRDDKYFKDRPQTDRFGKDRDRDRSDGGDWGGGRGGRWHDDQHHDQEYSRERKIDRDRGPDRLRSSDLGESGWRSSPDRVDGRRDGWKRSPDRRGFDHSPRRDERPPERVWRSDDRRHDNSPPSRLSDNRDFDCKEEENEGWETVATHRRKN